VLVVTNPPLSICQVGCCCPETAYQEEDLNYFVIWLVEVNMKTATPCQPEALLTPFYLQVAVRDVAQA